MAEPITLNNCDREPIHIPGATQPHGVLLVLNDAMEVVQVNSSAPGLLGLKIESILNQPLSSFVDAQDARHITGHLALKQRHQQPIYLRPIKAGQHRFDAILHRSEGLTILELEPVESELPPADPYALVQEAIVNFRTAKDLDDLVRQMARHVRTLNGFDRVMVYRFDKAWNGQVIAEEKREDLEPFFGLNYPASDIPVQARELYKKNWLRFIADRDYVSAPLIPQINPDTNRPLDMSFCVLRSVSPIHLEYLRNMGVGASMSISLICNGELWGLVACHHYSPRRVPYQFRSAAELLGQVMSLQVVASNSVERERESIANEERINGILRKFDPARGTISLVETCGSDICDLLDCGGLAVVSDSEVARFGQAPAADAVLEIFQSIKARGAFEIFETESVSSLIGRGTLDPIASGLIAIGMTADATRTLIGFRPERVRTVNWAGDPVKSITKGDGEEVRLSPRGSFALWKQTVEGQSHPWSSTDLAAARILRQRCMEKLVAHAEEVHRHNQVLRQHGQEQERLVETERAARLNVEHLGRVKDDFVATLSHELRTPLNAIQGWAQLLRARPNLDDDVEEALDVIERNTRVQVQMVDDLLDMSRITSGKLRLDVQNVDLPGTIEAAIATVQMAADAKDIQIVKFLDPLYGVSLTGDPNRLQQVFWNLLSNAVKFSPKGSRIRVELKRVNSHIEASVRDNGIGIEPSFLPHVFDRFRQGDQAVTRQQRGLGLGLSIVRNLVELHGGTISVQSPGVNEGSVFFVTLPVRAVTMNDAQDVHPTADRGRPLEDKVNLKGLNLLVVEDEFDSRELLRRLLERSGAEVSTAGSAADALHQLFDRRFDAMISDIGLPSQDGYYLIEQLRQLESRTNRPKMPAVAVTAYARTEDRRRIMLAGFQVHIAKPVEPDELRAIIAAVTGRV